MKNNLPPGGIPQGQPTPQVDFSQATDVLCDRCGNATFQEVVLMKHLSAIASPTGRAGNVPIPTFACVACGWVNAGFLPPFLRNKNTEQSTRINLGDTTPADSTKLTIVKS